MAELEVGFYLLPSHSATERLLFACRLIEKIYRSGQSCFVRTLSAEQAAELDKLLWTFRPGSFVPHQLYQGSLPALPQTVLIGDGEVPAGREEIVVNLADLPPAVMPGTHRLLEVLDNSEACLKAGRDKYRHYKQLGVDIKTHRL